MSNGRRYVLVNTFNPRKFILCDREGETYPSLARALVARESARAHSDNPWIEVFRLERVDESDLE
jgi:hypothetical protein